MAWIAALGLAVTTAPSTLRDVDGAPHPIEVAPGEQLLVVVFLGTECPLARLYVPRLNELHRRYGSRGVRFLAIDSLEHDHAERVRAFAAQHQLEFPIAKDQGTTIADALRATRTPEVVVLDAQQRVRYRGRIDDQYRVGRHRSQATEHDLRRAIDELLAGKEVSVPEIEASGCLIPRRKPAPAASRWTYAEHIAPLINSHCATCHAAGRVGPMPLDSFEQVAAWASTIDEVVAARRMPPWHADRQFGRFANDLSLDDWQREMLRRWIAEGCPRGNVEPLPQSRSTVAFEWTIGVPDRVVSMPAEFVVPARGIIEYQVFDIDPGFTADRWATALEI
ncbi:MAG TPA: redoxin domain-containing protein, partial [Pirellulales bacterium]|nr:redoxin domain-containing protein [Pirellulales bacterium]